MPVYSRRNLRQRLGTEWLHDTLVAQTSGSWGVQAGSLNIVDSSQADPTASGEQMHHRSWLRLLGSAGWIQDVRVGSFNTGSGAFLSAQTLATAIFSGMPFEVHSIVAPADKERALDGVIRQIAIGPEEVPLWTVDDAIIYSLGPEILDVLDVKYWTDPVGSRGEGNLAWWGVFATATGQELRISPALEQSQQLILSATLRASLGAGDLATINLPSDEWVLWGAAARCYWMLERQSPGQEAAAYAKARGEAGREYTRLSELFRPKVARELQLERVW